jgi:hypothetical protein
MLSDPLSPRPDWTIPLFPAGYWRILIEPENARCSILHTLEFLTVRKDQRSRERGSRFIAK